MKKILSKDFAEKIDGLMFEKGTLLTMYLAIEGRPDFAVAKSNPKINEAFVYLCGYETINNLVNRLKAAEWVAE